MSFIIDAHAHIYPNKIATKASASIGKFYDIPMNFSGTVDDLLELGAKNNIDMFLVQSVATAPEQVPSINNFITKTVEDHPNRLIGFATLHPDMANIPEEIDRVLKAGLLGIKLHPDFQKFHINDRSAYKIYEAAEGRLPILMHTGDSRYHYSNPQLVPEVLKDFPKLQMICAHFGGWSQWNEAERYLTDQNIWIDTSSSLYALGPEKAAALIRAFGEDRVLFGTDYPMWDPADEIRHIERLALTDSVKSKIFYKNIAALLNLKF